MTSTNTNPTDLNQEQEQLLAKRLYRLCKDAVETEKNFDEKNENVSLKRAEQFIQTLDAKIQFLADDFTLSKTNIINSTLGAHEYLIKNTMGIPEYIIKHKMASLFDLIVEGENNAHLSQWMTYACQYLNEYAFRILHQRCNPEFNVQHVLLVLNATPKDEQEAQIQQRLAEILLDENKRKRFINGEHAKSVLDAACLTLNNDLFMKFIPLFPWSPIQITILDQLTAKLTPETKEKVETIFLTVIEYSVLDVHTVLVNVARLDPDSKTPALVLLKLRERHQFNLSAVEKDTICPAVLYALAAAGTEFNPDPETGDAMLGLTTKKDDPRVLEALLSTTYFYPAQLTKNAITNADIYSKKPSLNYFKKMALLVKYGAALRRNKGVDRYAYLTGDLIDDFEKMSKTLTPSESQEIQDTIVEMNTKGIAALSKQNLGNTFSSFVNSMLNVKSPLNAKIWDSFISAGADPYESFKSGETILFALVVGKEPEMLRTLQQMQNAHEKILMDYGKFYYKIKNSNKAKPLDTHFGLLETKLDSSYKESNDLFLLADGDAKTIEVLMEFGLPVQAETIAVYQSLSVLSALENQANYANAVTTLNTYRRNWIKPDFLISTNKKSISNDIESTEIKLSPIFKANKRTLSVNEINQLEHKDFIAINKPQLLTKALLTLLDKDLEQLAHGTTEPFKDTMRFIEKMKKSRFDYMTILTDDDTLPLTHLIDKATNDNVEHIIDALRLMLSFTPFTQLSVLKKDEKAFKTKMKKLPEPLQKFLTTEFDKPRADMADLTFYLKSRSEKPDDQFFERAPVFSTLYQKLLATPDKPQEAIKSEIGNTTVYGFAGQTTRILKAMQNDLGNQGSIISYAKHLRFSFTKDLKHPTIVHAVHAIQNTRKPE